MYSPQTAIVGQNPFEANVAYIKKFFGRPIILIYAILVTITTGISFYTMYKMSGSMSDFGNMTQITAFKSVGTVTLVIYGIIYASILFALYYIFFSSHSSNPAVRPSAGFTILQVYLVIGIIFISIIIAALVFVGIVAALSSDISHFEYYWDQYAAQMPELGGLDSFMFDSHDVIVGLLIVIFTVATILAIFLTYIIALFRFLSSAKYNMKNLVMKVKGSTYFGVWTIIFACISVIIFLISLAGKSALNGFASSYGGYLDGDTRAYLDTASQSSLLTTVSSVLSIVNSIILAIIALSYSGYVKHGIIQASAVAYAMPVVPMVAGNPYVANPYMAAQAAPAQRAMAGDPAQGYAPQAAVPVQNTMPQQPAAQPQAAPVQAQPAAQPQAAPVQAQPAAQPQAAPVQAQPAAQPQAAPVQAQPAAQPQAAPVQAQPAAPAEEQPVYEEEAPAESEPETAWPAKKVCPNCGTEHDASAVYCGNCGSRIP